LDPFGFEAGDPNLYRYVGNRPTNATDPSGQFIVFEDEAKAKAFADELTNKYKAKFVGVIKGKGGAYVITDPRDRDAVFAYADATFGGVFIATSIGDNAKAKEIAERRIDFLRAAGVLGLDPKFWTDAAGNQVGANQVDWLGPVTAEVKKRMGIKECNPPLHIDIGGERLIEDRINVNIIGLVGGKPIPRLIPRIGRAGTLPFEDKSVARITMENVPLTGDARKVTASEIARIVRPGGTIYISNAESDVAKEIANSIIGAVGNRGTVDQKVVAQQGVKVLVTVITVK
jgi:hypothetical protein